MDYKNLPIEEKERILKEWIPKVGEMIWVYDGFVNQEFECKITKIMPNGTLITDDPYMSSVYREYYQTDCLPLKRA